MLIAHEQFGRTSCSVLQDVKVKFSSSLSKHQPTKTDTTGVSNVQLYSFWKAALDGCGWLASRHAEEGIRFAQVWNPFLDLAEHRTPIHLSSNSEA
jgi:hypothetical protein